MGSQKSVCHFSDLFILMKDVELKRYDESECSPDKGFHKEKLRYEPPFYLGNTKVQIKKAYHRHSC